MDEGSVLSVEGVGGSFHCRYGCAVYAQQLNRAAVDLLTCDCMWLRGTVSHTKTKPCRDIQANIKHQLYVYVLVHRSTLSWGMCRLSSWTLCLCCQLRRIGLCCRLSIVGACVVGSGVGACVVSSGVGACVVSSVAGACVVSSVVWACVVGSAVVVSVTVWNSIKCNRSTLFLNVQSKH